MATFAVIKDNKIHNVIVADTKEIAEEATGLPCLEIKEEEQLGIGHDLPKDKVAKIEKERAKRDAEIATRLAAEEAERIKAIESENERLRQAEADRFAAEEASKPKPVSGIFVKVSQN